MISDVTSKGLEAQLKAEIRANELGFIVSKPTTECCRYDMIIDDWECLKRIQVKYCGCKSRGSTGAVQLSLTKTSINGNKRPFYKRGEVDAIVVYVKPADCLCYFPIDVVDGKKSINIRYEPSKNNQTNNVFNCVDFLW